MPAEPDADAAPAPAAAAAPAAACDDGAAARGAVKAEALLNAAIEAYRADEWTLFETQATLTEAPAARRADCGKAPDCLGVGGAADSAAEALAEAAAAPAAVDALAEAAEASAEQAATEQAEAAIAEAPAAAAEVFESLSPFDVEDLPSSASARAAAPSEVLESAEHRPELSTDGVDALLQWAPTRPARNPLRLRAGLVVSGWSFVATVRYDPDAPRVHIDCVTVSSGDSFHAILDLDAILGRLEDESRAAYQRGIADGMPHATVLTSDHVECLARRCIFERQQRGSLKSHRY
ncbi:hypothetical protein M885DRAFT_590169, partial [Pelagophyceae sp. CCMP2097]